jgi:hypothetical protein
MCCAGGAAEAGLAAAARAAAPLPAIAAERQRDCAERCCCVCLPWQTAAGAAASCCVQLRMSKAPLLSLLKPARRALAAMKVSLRDRLSTRQRRCSGPCKDSAIWLSRGAGQTAGHEACGHHLPTVETLFQVHRIIAVRFTLHWKMAPPAPMADDAQGDTELDLTNAHLPSLAEVEFPARLTASLLLESPSPPPLPPPCQLPPAAAPSRRPLQRAWSLPQTLPSYACVEPGPYSQPAAHVRAKPAGPDWPAPVVLAPEPAVQHSRGGSPQLHTR